MQPGSEPDTAVRTAQNDLGRRVLEFCRLLRDQGLAVTPAHSLAAASALRLVDVGDREDFRLALRAVLARGPSELETFERTFRVFWEGALGARRQVVEDQLAVPARDATERWSPFEALAAKDFAEFVEDQDRAGLEDALRRIARKLAARRSRRLRAARRGGRVDVRRTIRRSLRFGGAALDLARRKPDIRKTRLVVICDVSRSMDQYSRFLLQFVYAFQRALKGVDSFVFGTRLTRVTRYFRTGSIHDAVTRISGEVPDWSGGTRIGASLHTFNGHYRSAVDSSTTVLILSDGLDTGDIELLDTEMSRLASRAKRVIWLNPLLGGGEPLRPVAGMQAALPYVDTFAPGNNLASLEALASAL